ncbi:glycosyl transferase family 1 [Candidatus Falkowbacteria bacterium CG11_big_fil_rev_8_21_14_0_20_39_10]|uniref:Glycosyl transferase family 1 n=1 Tax=Candidatus Falkowbacteria bacterium CG11_big_fil_rev_8_21_14_0_20_39_10 TaxID=1974570 RepID=A0A2M6KA38_9BACT|nr:MAG: glycosyl transferase family 1 [Candidatus Falkowbacteria bacterium CG11_big_fil_rev_8_21_14_0_20_39_10]
MKIVFIGQKGIPAKGGGVERHVEELATRLVRAGHEVMVYTRPGYVCKNLKEYKGVKLISLPSIHTKHFDAITSTFLACLDLIFKREVDIVHFHSIGPSSLILLVKIFKPRVPVIATFHTQCYYHKKWGVIARAYLKFGEFICCLMADKTIAVSKNLKKYGENKYKRKMYYIPNGVSIGNNLKPYKIKNWNLKEGGYILTVSRLVKHKGLHYLIEAYKDLKTDKKLVITGGGAFTDDYVEELKLISEGNKNIIFTGNQIGDALSELYSNAYFFVQSSEFEGLSIALLEAMSYGRAVLVSDIPGNKEVVEEISLTFRNKDVVDLGKKMEHLLENPELVKEIGRVGKARVKKYYNWEDIVDDIINVYKNVLGNKKLPEKISELSKVSV